MTLASLLFETRQITVNGELVFALAWLVLVLSIGAIFLLMVMIRDGEMSKVASLFYLVPAVTAVIAWALFGEELDAGADRRHGHRHPRGRPGDGSARRRGHVLRDSG